MWCFRISESSSCHISNMESTWGLRLSFFLRFGRWSIGNLQRRSSHDMGYTIEYKMVKNDVKITNRWKTYEGVQMPKLGFLPSTMHMLERGCVCKILHACTDGTCALLSWKTDTCTQEQACVRMNIGCECKNMSTHALLNLRMQEQTQKGVLQHFQSFLNQNST